MDRETAGRIRARVSAPIAMVLQKPNRRATLHLADARRYVAYAETIPGWFDSTDLYLFDFMLGRQLVDSVAGDVLEIGSYQGKSTILLGYGVRSEDVLVVCDLFGADPAEEDVPEEGMAAYDGLTLGAFRKNYGRFHTRLPQIEVCPSFRLSDRIRGRRFRFLHIDGSHAYDAVRGDIDLALDIAIDDAVVVLDDYRSPHTPGVAAAVWEAVIAGRLYPFAISEMKMYAAVSPQGQRDWAEASKKLAEQPRWDSEVHMVKDHEVVRLHFAHKRNLPFG